MRHIFYLQYTVNIFQIYFLISVNEAIFTMIFKIFKKELLDIQATHTLKHVCDMIKTYSQMYRTDKYSQHSSIIWLVWLNSQSVCLRTKWLSVPVPLQSLKYTKLQNFHSTKIKKTWLQNIWKHWKLIWKSIIYCFYCPRLTSNEHRCMTNGFIMQDLHKMSSIDVITLFLITLFTTVTISMSMYLHLKRMLTNSCSWSVTK